MKKITMRVKVDTRGLDRLRRNLQVVQASPGGESVQIRQLLTPRFLTQHTSVGSLEELFASSPNPAALHDSEKLQTPEWDAYIRRISGLSSWGELLQRAATVRVKEQLFQGISG